MNLLELQNGWITDIKTSIETESSGYCETCYHEWNVKLLKITFQSETDADVLEFTFDEYDEISESRLTYLILNKINYLSGLTWEQFKRVMELWCVGYTSDSDEGEEDGKEYLFIHKKIENYG